MRKHLRGLLVVSAAFAAVSACSKPAEEAKPGAAAPAAPAAAPADDKGPIKVGILHSLSGTMAISETSLKDVALMTIEEINEKGGVLGRKLEPVVVDPASEYLMSKKGGGAKRWVLLGTDYVYPRTTNKILRYFLHEKGVADDDIMEKYTPFGHSDYQTIVADIKKFATGKRTAVVSTINGDSNVPFYKELGNQGIKATELPVVAFSVGEEELRGIDTKPL